MLILLSGALALAAAPLQRGTTTLELGDLSPCGEVAEGTGTAFLIDVEGGTVRAARPANPSDALASCLAPHLVDNRVIEPTDASGDGIPLFLEWGRSVEREIAENAGILAALRECGEDEDCNEDWAFGSRGLSTDLTGGVGSLIGAKGRQLDNSPGGGGAAEGQGGLGTQGQGSPSSDTVADRARTAVVRRNGEPIVMGALDPVLVEVVIKRSMNQIRYCYQKEVVKTPDIGGTQVVAFTVASDGSVASARTKSTTLDHEVVETCVIGRFMRMRFPVPRDGSVVVVSYPLLFSPDPSETP